MYSKLTGLAERRTRTSPIELYAARVALHLVHHGFTRQAALSVVNDNASLIESWYHQGVKSEDAADKFWRG